jgi:hypothetical protein
MDKSAVNMDFFVYIQLQISAKGPKKELAAAFRLPPGVLPAGQLSTAE